MRSIIILILSLLSFHVEAKLVDHKVQGDETAWFLSQIYYGTGARYPEILKTNSLSSAESLQPGSIVKIENPVFDPQQKGFEERFATLKKKRETELGLGWKASDHAKKVVVPNDKIANSLRTTLPFTDVKDPHKSALQRAKEEMEPRRSSSEKE